VKTTCTACLAAEKTARTAWIEEHIHETASGRWVVASHDARTHNWTASMTPRTQRLTGCSQVSARSLNGIARDGSVQTYTTRAGAVRAAADGIANATMGALCAAHRRELIDQLRAERDREDAEFDARVAASGY